VGAAPYAAALGGDARAASVPGARSLTLDLDRAVVEQGRQGAERSERGGHQRADDAQRQRELDHGLVALLDDDATGGALLDDAFGFLDEAPGRVRPTRDPGRGRLAVTHWRVLRAGSLHTLLEVRLETGRTHQIRIHLAESGHPLVGEKVYVRDFVASGRAPIASPRLMLHAKKLSLRHPIDGQMLSFESSRTSEFLSLVEELRRS